MRLGALLQKTGTTDPTKEPTKSFTYIDVSSVSNETFVITETSKMLGKDAPSRARRIVRSGDVIFATIRPTLKRIAIVPEELDCAVCSTGYFVLRGGSKIDNAYLFYWLFCDEFQAEMEARQKGASYPAVNDSDMRDQSIPLPPLDEQRRIVAVLDKAFAGIATATANAQKNLTNARALFDGFLESVFSTEAEGWQIKTLAQTCKMYQPKTISTKEMVPGGPFPVFGANGIIGRYNKFNHAEPQLLITCRGATCGSVNVSLANSWITGNAMVVRPLNESIDLKFLEFYFRGGIDISKAITGAAQPQITRTNLETLEIHFPKDVFEQRRIATVSTHLLEAVERLEAIIDDKLAALTELKQSLLQKAFAGELT